MLFSFIVAIDMILLDFHLVNRQLWLVIVQKRCDPWF